MARGINGFGQSVLSLAVLAVLAGCTGGPGVTQNPASSGSGNGGIGGTNPGTTNPTPNTPGTSNPGTNNPGTTTPPPVNEAIGDPATATANSAVLTTTQTRVYNLNTAVLGGNGWQPAALLETTGGEASSPRVAFDADGNGLALWAQGNHVYVSRYTSASGEWGAPYSIDISIDEVQQPQLAVDRQSGDAVATWIQNDNGIQSIFASRYTASNQSWSTPQPLETSNVPVSAWGSNVAIAGAHAAAVWRQDNGTGSGDNDLYLARFVNGAWTSPQLVDASNQNAENPDVAVDLNGNATVVWQQYDDQLSYEDRIHARRWDANSGTLGAIQQLDDAGDHQPRLQFDAQGNGFLLWRGGGVYARRFANGLWGPELKLDNDDDNDAYAAELSVDAAGNAMAVWVESDGTEMSMFARRFKTSTGWGNVESLETSNVAINLDETTVSLSGEHAVVAWLQNTPINGSDDVRTDVYGAKLSEGVWESATLLESRGESATQLASGITSTGNAAVLWVQPESIYQARHLTSNFRVQAGDTWQSIANTLYGVNSAEAGAALQAAMGGVTLTEGMILDGFPATLSVTTAIPPYYTVLATDTWAHIAQRVYGVTDAAAIAQLQTLLGNPTLTAGQHLVVPTTVTYTTSANYRAPLDWSRVNTTVTEHHPLDRDLLTVPLNNWGTPSRIENDNAAATGPRLDFDANRNGIAVWAQANDIKMSRYTASTGQWSAPAALASATVDARTPRVTIDRETGDAVVAWAQDDGAGLSMYVSSYDASENSWSTPLSLESSNLPVNGSSEAIFVAKRGEHAAVAWLQANGALLPNGDPVSDVLLSRLVAGTWTAPAVIDTASATGLHPEVAIDNNGNATVAWRQIDSSVGYEVIFTRRWNNNTQSYGPVVVQSEYGDRQPRLRFDAEGNGILLWRGGGVYARHYDASTDSWSDDVTLHTNEDGGAYNGELAVDSNGDALATYTEYVGTTYSIYARHYDSATRTWSDPMLLENMSTPANIENDPTISLVNGSGMIAWLQDNGVQDLYGARFSNGVWGEATLLDDRVEESPYALTSAIDNDGNATVLWLQDAGWDANVYQIRSTATPYFTVPAGATWQSLASTLYGANSAAAGDALSTAMGNPALTTGLQLAPLPQTLTVNPPVPTHYVVRTGDTWQSITLALYGTNRSEAATALWVYLGRPTLTVGQQLVIPAELSYTIDEE